MIHNLGSFIVRGSTRLIHTMLACFLFESLNYMACRSILTRHLVELDGLGCLMKNRKRNRLANLQVGLYWHTSAGPPSLQFFVPGDLVAAASDQRR